MGISNHEIIAEENKKLKERISELEDEQNAFIEVCQEPCKDCKLNEIKIFMKTQGIALNSHENEIRAIKEQLNEIYTGSSLLQNELDIRVDILKTVLKVFRIEKIETIIFLIGKELLMEDAPKWNDIWEKIEIMRNKGKEGEKPIIRPSDIEWLNSAEGYTTREKNKIINKTIDKLKQLKMVMEDQISGSYYDSDGNDAVMNPNYFDQVINQLKEMLL